MNVDLPTTGCVVLNSSTTFYHYYDNDHYRDSYIIYEGVAHKQSTSYNVNGYTYSGTCLTTGDLVYRPELQVYFPVLGFILFCFIMVLLYNIIIKRLLK